ncbi:DGQHR domain-containing protein [Sulfitobacter sp. M39]|uniref:DGQHR domain-containing protein n=1 Tax=Sulfitobacter sp. M39 TaxID=2675334 RepID=UPI001F23A5E0|nr:DGQHR domain-containing protein [Sulfitobacter sp. M39]MCF7748062.1 DGQHR domain-containing protein [Sulfitobacter sp. M39]
MRKEPSRLSFGTVSLVTQGEHKFYTTTIQSEVLARTCIAISREEDNIAGFQRVLDRKRAQDIADYIDNGLGTVPSSIVLSAQDDADLVYSPKAKSISFKDIQQAFLILDGQHRVYGFSLAKSNLRVPVVIYDNLNKREESRLFIDINSKQKGVPTELLLDIKKMAEYENDAEARMRVIFDWFKDDPSTILYGKLSSAKKVSGKITRTLFNSAVGPLVKLFGGMSDEDVYQVLASYYQAVFDTVFQPRGLAVEFYQPTVFKAISGFFPTVARRTKYRHGSVYTYDYFSEILDPARDKLRPAKVKEAKNAYKPLVKHFEECLDSDFLL